MTTETELVQPLARFCEGRGDPLPAYRAIEGAAMPEPHRGLLVHEGDMTSKLEAFHGSRTRLTVLERRLEGDTLAREVLLVTEDDGVAVEYGAIEIDLGAFDPQPRALIEAGDRPLGGILIQFGIPFRSSPQAFIEILPNPGIIRALDIAGGEKLYGRCNLLSAPDGTTFARIVEILPPER